MSPASRVAVLLLPCVAACGDDERACAEQHESFVRSTDIGNLTDSTEAPLEESGELSECNHEDYFHYRGHDHDLLDINRPTIDLSYDSTGGAEIEACVYVACDKGATDLEDCETESARFFPIESQLGFRGCCRVGAGSMAVEYTCDNGLGELVSRDTADFFVHICAHQIGEATRYRLSAGF